MTTRERTAKSRIYDYERSTATELSNVYGRYSEAKARSYEYIRDEMNRLEGWGLRIISHNCNIYTCGYLYTDPETGVIRFVYHTPTYRAEVDY